MKMKKRTTEQVKKDILTTLFNHGGKVKQNKLFMKANLSQQQFKKLCSDNDLNQYLEIERQNSYKFICLNEAGYLALNL